MSSLPPSRRVVPSGTLKNMRQASRQSQGNPINHALDSQAILRDLMPGYSNALRLPDFAPGVIPAKPLTARRCSWPWTVA